MVTKKNNYRKVGRLGIPEGKENDSTEEIWCYIAHHANPNQIKFKYISDEDKIEKTTFGVE